MDCSPAKTRDPEKWLRTAPEVSRPLAHEVRERLLRWEPDLTESIKWNMLCLSGRKLVCGSSACKKHLGITFFRGTEIHDPQAMFTPNERSTNIRSIKVRSLDGFDLRALRQMLAAAVSLDAFPALPPPPRGPRREDWPMPPALEEALARNRPAADFFNELKPSYQREYNVWIGTAKRAETRDARLRQTLAALRAGKKWARRKDA